MKRLAGERSSRFPLALGALAVAIGIGLGRWLRSTVDPGGPDGTPPRESLVSEYGCFEGPNLPRSWEMDPTHVDWIQGDARFEDGTFIDGAREGCWRFWYHDGLFDSGRSGTYQKGMKVVSAPSPLGDFRDE